MAEPSSRLDRIARVAQIAQAVSIVLGIIVAVANIYTSREAAGISLRNIKLSSLTHISNVIKEDGDIQEKLSNIDIQNLPSFSTLLAARRTASRNVYYSNELKDFAAIGEHFERMGAMVKLGYIDFDLLFEIIPFPDEFWNESREWRYQIRDNWRGPGKPLNDFWANFKYLCDRYYAQRYLDELKAKKQAFCWSCLVPGFQAKPPGCEY